MNYHETHSPIIGASAASSGFANDLGKLRTLGLIDYPAAGMVWIGSMFQ